MEAWQNYLAHLIGLYIDLEKIPCQVVKIILSLIMILVMIFLKNG